MFESGYLNTDSSRAYLTSVKLEGDKVEVHCLEYENKVSGIKRIEFSLQALKELAQSLM